ncbi:hypothetical protein, partial [Oceanisphaera sediminis]|uniref:hypothetical protein n=1 Tax=Oceanisphaera sediminis TaxID=981381 RepID=UPI0031E5499B
ALAGCFGMTYKNWGALSAFAGMTTAPCLLCCMTYHPTVSAISLHRFIGKKNPAHKNGKEFQLFSVLRTRCMFESFSSAQTIYLFFLSAQVPWHDNPHSDL